MSEGSQNVTCMESIKRDNRNSGDESDTNKCVKLLLDDHISAYLNKALIEPKSEQNNLSELLVQKVFLNYIIVKQILSNLPWQDKLLCKEVCKTWHSAMQSLKKEQLSPEDFALDLRFKSNKASVKYKQSGKFYNEPLVVMIFTNSAGFCLTSFCNKIQPPTCSVPCNKEHALLDMVHKFSSAPKDCLNIMKCEYLSYMPLPHSITYKHYITHLKPLPFMGGLYIPAVPDVKYHTLNLRTYASMKRSYYDYVNKLTKDRIVKGVLVFVTDKYLLHPVEDIIFVNYLKDVQPDNPYALGGCIIEDTIFQECYLNDIIDGVNNKETFVSENLISMGFFTIPKSNPENEYNFSMYSLVIPASDIVKTKIQDDINQFAKRVPQYEHSVALKLSCIGRDQKHTYEQNCFRAAFPNTRIVGCYGNGELGHNCPEKPQKDTVSDLVKRQRLDCHNQFEIIYSYSTVFVYIGWGKVTSLKTKQ